MPYDRPRPEDKSRGPIPIKTPISRIAPKGALRVIGIDTKSRKEWVEDDFFMTRKQVFEEVWKLLEGQRNLKFVLFDDKGQFVPLPHAPRSSQKP